MTFLSILCVLVLEQLKAVPAIRIQAWQAAHAAWIERRFNGGEVRHGVLAWVAAVLTPTLIVLALQLLAFWLHPLVGFVFHVAVLYLLVGFRQFSHYFTDIQMALRMGEIDRAREQLAQWRGEKGGHLGTAEVARLSIEQGVVHSHRLVFAPLLWFVLLGPAGALLYRLSLGMAQTWNPPNLPAREAQSPFGHFARRAFFFLDWLPVRLTAATFAVVGDFEDAIYCWRTQASQWPDAATGILLASGAGALGLRLGLPVRGAAGGDDSTRPQLGLGEDVAIEHLQSAVGLVWRALVVCLLLLALLTLAGWAGG